MDAPKCRLCGEKHWGGCSFIEAPIRVTKAAAVSHPVTPVSQPDVDNALANAMDNGKPAKLVSYRYRDPEKRRAYMRGLMRRKRART